MLLQCISGLSYQVLSTQEHYFYRLSYVNVKSNVILTYIASTQFSQHTVSPDKLHAKHILLKMTSL